MKLPPFLLFRFLLGSAWWSFRARNFSCVQEREERLEAQRRNSRGNMEFAFGSSAPRLVDRLDSSYWVRRSETHHNQCSGSGIRCLFQPLDPGWVKIRIRIRDEQPGSYFLRNSVMKNRIEYYLYSGLGRTNYKFYFLPTYGKIAFRVLE